MKRSHHHKLAILPLLGILAMSPSVMTSKYASRGLASVEDGKQEVKKEEVKKEEIKEESKTPKFDALVSKVDKTTITKDLEITLDKFKVKRDELSAKLKKEREDFKKDQSDKVVVEEQQKKVESLVTDVVLVEGALKDLQEKKGIEQADDEASQKLISESKDIVESLLNDVDSNKVLVAKASEPKVEEPKKEEPKKEEPKVADEKKDEPKKEEVKKEEVKVTENKDEGKKEEKKEEKKEQTESEKQLCALQDQNKLLSKQVEQLINDQKQIMNTFMGMAQMMVGMYQQQQANQHNPYYQNGPGFNQSPYQYNAPMSAGNWVYYPQGFQPQQQNIFAQPQQMVGMYPDQFYGQQQQQGQAQWGLQPQMNFQQQQPTYGTDPRFTQYPQFQAGPFGDSAFSFNMTPQVSMTR